MSDHCSFPFLFFRCHVNTTFVLLSFFFVSTFHFLFCSLYPSWSLSSAPFFPFLFSTHPQLLGIREVLITYLTYVSTNPAYFQKMTKKRRTFYFGSIWLSATLSITDQNTRKTRNTLTVSLFLPTKANLVFSYFNLTNAWQVNMSSIKTK